MRSGSQPRVCRRPARTFVLPTPRVPDGLTITRFAEEASDTKAPKSSCPITESASAFSHCARRVLPDRVPEEDLSHARRASGRSRCWLVEYNYRRPHQGRWCFGKTPMQTFLLR